MVLFALMLYIPEMRQQVNGDSASTSGLYLIPMLLGLVVVAIIAGD